MEECERLNEDLSQSQNILVNISLDHHSNIAATPDDQSQIAFDNRSPPNCTPQADDETYVFEDKENTYVLYLRDSFSLLKIML